MDNSHKTKKNDTINHDNQVDTNGRNGPASSTASSARKSPKASHRLDQYLETTEAQPEFVEWSVLWLSYNLQSTMGWGHSESSGLMLGDISGITWNYMVTRRRQTQFGASCCDYVPPASFWWQSMLLVPLRCYTLSIGIVHVYPFFGQRFISPWLLAQTPAKQAIPWSNSTTLSFKSKPLLASMLIVYVACSNGGFIPYFQYVCYLLAFFYVAIYSLFP